MPLNSNIQFLISAAINILSGRAMTIVIVLVSIIARMIQLVFFYNIRVDASYQVMATRHFVEGNGVSFAEVLPTDLAITHYEPLVNWPPGYSLLLAPFYLLSGKNYILAGISMDIVFAVLLILMCRALLKRLGVPLYGRNIFTLLTSLFIYSFYFIASSDAIAISLFITAIYFAFRLVDHRKNILLSSVLITAFLLACAWTKYLLIPVVLILPVLIFIKGWLLKDLPLKKAGWITGTLLLAGIGALLLYQKYSTGTAAYISQPERGFFPGHLADFYPFIPAGFMRPDTWTLLTGLNEKFMIRCYQVLHVIALTMIVYWLFRFLKKRAYRHHPQQDFMLLSLSISAAITVLLAFLSLTVAKEEIWPGVFWTYIEETRYYGLAYVLLHLLAFVLYGYLKHHQMARRLLFALFILLAADSARGLVLVTNRIVLLGRETYSWQTEEAFQKYAGELLQKLQDSSGYRRAVIAGSSYYMNHRVSLHTGAHILYDQGSLNDPAGFTTTSPVLLLVMLQQDQLSKYQTFLSGKGSNLAGQYQGFNFYTVYVQPR